MRILSILFFVCFVFNQDLSAKPIDLPSVSHYSMRLRLYPQEGRFEAETKLTVANRSDRRFTELPFLLYRLLDVREVRNETGGLLHFTKKVVRFSDPNNLQVNSLQIRLRHPLRPGKTDTITIKYHGSIFGYPEVMGYVKDSISEQYSLIRPDALAYPLLSRLSWQSYLETYDARFTYDLEVTVPIGYIVACGGSIVKATEQEGAAKFVFTSKSPTSRIDIAAARFKLQTDEKYDLSVYFLPEDEIGTEGLIAGMKNAISFYSSLFGDVETFRGYTIIEIPEGWGSQVGNYYLLQTSAAFKDRKKLPEVYHEIAHIWGVMAEPEAARSRWFDEAFASYFQALAMREFDGVAAFEGQMQSYRESFIRQAATDKNAGDVPIVEYGKRNLGGLSYTKGAWSLYVLHCLVGQEKFNLIVRTLLSEFKDKPANFKDFQRVAVTISGRNLDRYFNDWIFGSASSNLLVEKIAIGEIVNRYR